MPKVTWGGLSAQDIDEASDSGTDYTPYDGPEPIKGVYQFKLRLKKGKSQAGNDKLTVSMTLVPRRGRPEDKKYDGYHMMDFIPVMASTAFRVRPFLEALGVTSKQFMTQCITDEDGVVQKIGTKKADAFYALAFIVRDKDNTEYMKVSKWIPLDQAASKNRAPAVEEPAADADDDDDDSGEDAPF